MKKIFLITFLLVSSTILAQNKDREKIKALKVSFITEKLDLTKKEAQEFWPIYNEFEKSMSEVRYREMRSIRSDVRKDLSNMTDAQAKELIKRYDSAENKSHNLKIEFSNKLQKVISSKKIILLKIAEDDFKRKMFEELKKSKKRKNQ